MSCLFGLFRCRTEVHQIDDAHVRDARIGFETDFTGTAVRVAHLNLVGLDLRTEFSESVLVELWEGEATIASESATAYALGQEHVGRTEFGQGNHILIYTHLSGRTSEVQGNALIGRMEVEAVYEILHDKLGGLVELHLLHHLFHAMQTRTLSAEHWIFTLLGGFPEGGLEFGTLTIGNVEHTLRLPDLSAAHTLHTFWEDDLVASPSAQTFKKLIHHFLI